MIFKLLTRTAAVGSILLMTLPANARNVDEADVEQGEVEIQINNSYTDENTEGKYERETELEIQVGITNILKLGAELEFEEEENESPFHLKEIGISLIIAIIKAEARGFDLSLYGGLSHERAENANEVTAGVLAETTVQQITLRGNALYKTDLNESDEQFEAFDLAYQAKYQFAEKYALGVEGFFVDTDFQDPTEADTQTHMVGPVFYYEGGIMQTILNSVLNRHRAERGSMKDDGDGDGDDEGLEVSGNFGVLFGTNDDTADVTVKWYTEIEF